MSDILSKPKLIKRFMEKSGYCNLTETDGIQKTKNGKRDSGLCWDYHSPEKMLRDFLRWLKKEDGPVIVERNINYTLIGKWVAHYRLLDTAGGFQAHPNSIVHPNHALIIWQLKGIRSSVQVGKAFDISAKAARDIWHRRSWGALIRWFEESK